MKGFVPFLTSYGLIWLILLGSGLGEAVAQLNESDTTRFQGRLGVTGVYQGGNVDYLALRGNLTIAARLSEVWAFKTQNTSLYQEFFGRKADNDLFSRNYIYFKPESKVYPFGIVYIATNFRRKIDLRYFAGIGVTYQPVITQNHTIKLALNAVFEESRFNTERFNVSRYDSKDIIDVWRGTFYVGGWSSLLKDRMRLSYEGFYQPAFEASENYRTQLFVSLDFPVWKGFYLSANYTYSHENVVPLGIEEDDTILTFGIGYAYKSK